MPQFQAIEIPLPQQLFTSGPQLFSEAWSISPSSLQVVGTAGERALPGTSLDGGNFSGFNFFPRRSEGVVLRNPKVDYPSELATSVTGVNDRGDLVGFFRHLEGAAPRPEQLHGFIWLNGDAAMRFDIPGASFPEVAPRIEVTNAVLGINNDRVAVGVYRDAATAKDFGFVARVDGLPFLKVDLAEFIPQWNIIRTSLKSINSRGEIVGTVTSGDPPFTRGFKCGVGVDANNQLVLTSNPVVPDVQTSMGAVFSGSNNVGVAQVLFNGINDASVIVGYASLISHPTVESVGFMWEPDAAGTYQSSGLTFIDMDSVANGLDGVSAPRRTFPNGIDNSGHIVGAFRAKPSASPPIRRAFAGSFTELPPWGDGPRPRPLIPRPYDDGSLSRLIEELSSFLDQQQRDRLLAMLLFRR